MGQVETFGRYQLLRVAGAGGMALVHLARQIGPEGFVKPCVLKRIAPNYSTDDSVRAMFMEEARVSGLLNHPNIVQTFDYGEVAGVPYMAMELVDGVNLAQLCRALAKNQRWIPLSTAIEMILSVFEALDYAHQLTDLNRQPLHLVHRDVSPQNTLLSRQGTIKLSDFGIARHDAREHMTVGVSAKGKPGYMAPEQAMGGAVDGRADLFSAGIMLAELVSARRVLKSSQAVMGILDIGPRIHQLCSLRKEAPSQLVDFTTRLTSLKPELRPQTARAAILELRQIGQTLPPAPNLSDFLRNVFETFLKGQATGEGAMETVGGTLIDTPADLPEPPSATQSELKFERSAWDTQAEEATGTGVIYEQGWPKEFVADGAQPRRPSAPSPPAPSQEMEVVAHSSSVDAMQFFSAQVSEEAQAERHVSEDDEKEAADARAKQRRLPYVHSVRPTSSVQQTPLEPRPQSSPNLAPKSGAMMSAVDNPGLNQALTSLAKEDAENRSAEAAVQEKKPFSIPPIVPLAGAGLLIVAIGVGVMSLVIQDPESQVPTGPEMGSILIESTPPGARILINGRATDGRTPFEVKNLPIDRLVRVSVTLENHVAQPPELDVRIPPGIGRIPARFILKRGRKYRIESEPSEAIVTFNDHRLGELTPVELPVLPYGETATITVEQDGYLTHRMLLISNTESPTVAIAKLELGRQIEVTSEPAGATVILDGEKIGQTPMYDVLVPAKRRFRLQLTHRGYRGWKKRFAGRRVESPILVELSPLPFLRLPWAKNERRQARELDRTQHLQRQKVGRLKLRLSRAEAKQRQIESSINASVSDLAEVQRRTDLARDALAEAEQSLSDTEAAMESMREQLLLQFDGE